MTACHCKKCDLITKHRRTKDSNQWMCDICGTVRYYAKSFGAGDFPELTTDENEIIHEARAHGFSACFAAYPDANAQAEQTLQAAKKHMDQS